MDFSSLFPPARFLFVAASLMAAVPAYSAPTVLVVNNPGFYSDQAAENILTSWGVEFDTLPHVPGPVRLANYTTVIFAANQASQADYDDLNAHMGRVTKWLKGGARTFQFHGYNPYVRFPSLTLPRGVTSTATYGNSYRNIIKKPNHPFAIGVPRVIEDGYSELLVGTHELSPVVGKLVAVNDNEEPGATLLDYCVGPGRVIAADLAVELMWTHGVGAPELLPNMLNTSVYSPGCQNVTPE